MTRSTPQVTERPAAIRAYRPPISTPASVACRTVIAARLAPPGALRGAEGTRAGLGRPSAGRALQRARGTVGGPDHHPITVLDLLEAQCAGPEVVCLGVEREVAAERRVGALGMQVVAHR